MPHVFELPDEERQPGQPDPKVYIRYMGHIINERLIKYFLTRSSPKPTESDVPGLNTFNSYRILYQKAHNIHKHPLLDKVNMNLLQTAVYIQPRFQWVQPSPASVSMKKTVQFVKSKTKKNKINTQVIWDKLAIPTNPPYAQGGQLVTFPRFPSQIDWSVTYQQMKQQYLKQKALIQSKQAEEQQQQPEQSEQSIIDNTTDVNPEDDNTIIEEIPKLSEDDEFRENVNTLQNLPPFPNLPYSVYPTPNSSRKKNSIPIIIQPSVDYYIVIDFECTCFDGNEQKESNSNPTNNNSNNNDSNNTSSGSSNSEDNSNNNQSMNTTTTSIPNTPSGLSTTSICDSVTEDENGQIHGNKIPTTPTPPSTIQQRQQQQQTPNTTSNTPMSTATTQQQHQQQQQQRGEFQDNIGTKQAHEIIEFPAILIDAKNLTIVSIFHTYVKPTQNPILSDFCTNLTHITQRQVDNAPTIDIAVIMFMQWLFSYGIVFNTDTFKHLLSLQNSQLLLTTLQNKLITMNQEPLDVNADSNNNNTSLKSNDKQNLLDFADSIFLPNMNEDTLLNNLLTADNFNTSKSEFERIEHTEKYYKMYELTYYLQFYHSILEKNGDSITQYNVSSLEQQIDTVVHDKVLEKVSNMLQTFEQGLHIADTNGDIVTSDTNDQLQTNNDNNNGNTTTLFNTTNLNNITMTNTHKSIVKMDYYNNVLHHIHSCLQNEVNNKNNNTDTTNNTIQQELSSTQTLFQSLYQTYNESTTILNSQIVPHHPNYLENTENNTTNLNTKPITPHTALLISDTTTDFLGFLIPELKTKGFEWLLVYLFGIEALSLKQEDNTSEGLESSTTCTDSNTSLSSHDDVEDTSQKCNNNNNNISQMPKIDEDNVVMNLQGNTLETTTPDTNNTHTQDTISNPDNNNNTTDNTNTTDITKKRTGVRVERVFTRITTESLGSPLYFKQFNKKYISTSQLYFCNIRRLMYSCAFSSTSTPQVPLKQPAVIGIATFIGGNNGMMSQNYLEQFKVQLKQQIQQQQTQQNNNTATNNSNIIPIIPQPPAVFTTLCQQWYNYFNQQFPLITPTNTPTNQNSFLSEEEEEKYEIKRQFFLSKEIAVYRFGSYSMLPFKFIVGRYVGSGLPHFLKLFNTYFVGHLHSGINDSINIYRLLFHLLMLSDLPGLTPTGTGHIF